MPSSRILAGALAAEPFGLTADKLRGIGAMELGSAEVGRLKPIPALFQTGYLTVESVSYRNNKRVFTLKVPNREIGEFIFPANSERFLELLGENVAAESKTFLDALAARDEGKLSELLTGAFSTLAARHHPNFPEPKLNESYYHAMILFYLIQTAVDLHSEPAAAGGTPDMTILFPNGILAVVEIKYAKDPAPEDGAGTPEGTGKTGSGAEPPKKRRRGTAADKRLEERERKRSNLLDDLAMEAIMQIRTKGYHLPHVGRGETVLLVGIGIIGRGICRVRLEDPAFPNAASPRS